MDPERDPAAWADSFLDQHRTGPRIDRETEREAVRRALKDLPPATRRMLTRGGREPDLHVVERIQRNVGRTRTLQNWESIVTLVGLCLLCLFVFGADLGFL